MMYLRWLSLFLSCLAVTAFTTPRRTSQVAMHVTQKVSSQSKVEPSFLFKKPKEEEDLSYLEVRDMTREEMARLNEENERVMNAELWGMTIFSLILSVPMLYLVWVGFFSETAEMNLDTI
jgi:selenocysteine-specific elongation factor